MMELDCFCCGCFCCLSVLFVYLYLFMYFCFVFVAFNYKIICLMSLVFIVHAVCAQFSIICAKNIGKYKKEATRKEIERKLSLS